MDVISFNEFRRVDLRVGVIRDAERIEGYDKLLKLKVDIGIEERTLVAGIAQYYSPEDLIGKRIIMVVNLQPKTIAGITSQGMLLAVMGKEGLSLLTTDKEVEPGLRVE